MNLENAIRKHYQTASAIQNKITGDPPMVAIMQGQQTFNGVVAKRWMEDYGLFQGVKGPARQMVLMAVQSHLGQVNGTPIGINRDADIASKYTRLYSALYAVCPRAWTSATSKLLWCAFPTDIVIFDSFVERFIIVMQWFDDELTNWPRLGDAPAVHSAADIPQAVDFYMRFQKMVYALFQQHRAVFGALRQQHNVTYPYDIRIFDKIMWLTANPSVYP
jgi:hypothetical protein